MRICVFGAGAIGGNFAARLADAGNEVSVVVRGAHLEAIRANGLTLIAGDRKIVAKVRASDRPADLGSQDAVISTLKATGLGALADGVGPLLGPETPVVFAQNGIPWWYGHGLGPSRPPAPDLSRLDPGGALARSVGPERTLGGAITSPNHVVEPGVIVNEQPERNTLWVGEVDDRQTPRVAEIVNQLARRAHAEALAVAAAHGVVLDDSPEARYGARRVYTNHRPSILQDYDLGRPMEIESIVRAPVAFARSAGVPTPTLEAIEAFAVSLAASKGLYVP
jgi:2-dehydropantoate 2-reductase